MHSHNWIHRDIKPHNIFYRRNESTLEVVLGDFEFAVQNEDVGLEQPGTLAYMAPEMISFLAEYSFEVDIWSAGVIFAEMVQSVVM